MAASEKSPAIPAEFGDDTGARIDHIQDLIERAAAGSQRGLPCAFHEAAGAGAMRSVEDENVVLVTFVTPEGKSHIFAVDRAVARSLRTQLFNVDKR